MAAAGAGGISPAEGPVAPASRASAGREMAVESTDSRLHHSAAAESTAPGAEAVETAAAIEMVSYAPNCLRYHYSAEADRLRYSAKYTTRRAGRRGLNDPERRISPWNCCELTGLCVLPCCRRVKAKW